VGLARTDHHHGHHRVTTAHDATRPARAINSNHGYFNKYDNHSDDKDDENEGNGYEEAEREEEEESEEGRERGRGWSEGGGGGGVVTGTTEGTAASAGGVVFVRLHPALFGLRGRASANAQAGTPRNQAIDDHHGQHRQAKAHRRREASLITYLN
jgi:hypothetical protein